MLIYIYIYIYALLLGRAIQDWPCRSSGKPRNKIVFGERIEQEAQIVMRLADRYCFKSIRFGRRTTMLVVTM